MNIPKTVARNANWIYELDQDGKAKRDPGSMRPIMTYFGRRYAEIVECYERLYGGGDQEKLHVMSLGKLVEELEEMVATIKRELVTSALEEK